MTQVQRRDALTPDDQRRVDAVLAAAREADGVAALSEQAELAVARSAPDVEHFLVDVDGEVGAYANVAPGRDDEPPMAELVVAPEYRRRGLGRALIDAIVGAEPTIRLWAHGDLPAARALASAVGLTSQRVLLQLRRPLGGAELPELPTRDDIVLRTYAGVEDDAEILRVNNAAFEWHPEQGGWTPDDMAARTGSDWFDPEGLFLAFDAATPKASQIDAVSAQRRLLGFHWTKIHSSALGEVYIVGVDPGAQGRGLGRVLTLAGLHYLNPRVSECELYVEGDNTAAIHTYERVGFTQHAIDVAYGM